MLSLLTQGLLFLSPGWPEALPTPLYRGKDPLLYQAKQAASSLLTGGLSIVHFPSYSLLALYYMFGLGYL